MMIFIVAKTKFFFCYFKTILVIEDIHEHDSDQHSDENTDVKRWKIRAVESDTDSDDEKDKDSSEWEGVIEFESLPSRITFTNAQRATGLQVV